MTIKTRDFGVIEIENDSVINFTQPILGFEDYEFFVVLMDDEIDSGIAFLQCITEPELCFFIISLANALDEIKSHGEEISLTPESFRQIYGDDYEVFCILNLKDDFMDSTVNLRSPVLINPISKRGMQIVLEADYPVKQRLFGESSCEKGGDGKASDTSSEKNDFIRGGK
ncbi:MAG: flagellar assembly protein FliW [Ruminococcus sp.]|jgi:flagellar assembly factor FliW|nr:flagellar assembly protein FliW [Ruminococcus sp.]